MCAALLQPLFLKVVNVFTKKNSTVKFFEKKTRYSGKFRGSKKYVYTAQKMKFSMKDFFSKCDQVRRKTSFFVQC